jgi:hypothetical protein
MENELDIIRDVSARLERASIPYMLTGSMAMNYYAQPRMTRDIDVVVALQPGDVDTVLDLFHPDYYCSWEAVEAAIKHSSMFNLIHEETLIKVDCIVRKPTEYRLVEFDRRRRIGLTGFEAWMVSKEDLILSKLLWAKDSRSEMQLRDVKNLVATGYDQVYVHSWVERLGLTSVWDECAHD